jgi:hypothetical protein
MIYTLFIFGYSAKVSFVDSFGFLIITSDVPFPKNL